MKEVRPVLDPRHLPAFSGQWSRNGYRNQKGLSRRSSRSVYKMQLPRPPRRAALLLRLSAAPRSHGRCFGRDWHSPLNQMLCVLAIQGSSPHHFCRDFLRCFYRPHRVPT